jgi:hypothetical protein
MTNHGPATFLAAPDATGSVLLFAPHHGPRRGPRIDTHAYYASSDASAASAVARRLIWSACLLSAVSASGITALLLLQSTAFAG